MVNTPIGVRIIKWLKVKKDKACFFRDALPLTFTEHRCYLHQVQQARLIDVECLCTSNDAKYKTATNLVEPSHLLAKNTFCLIADAYRQVR